MIAACRKLCKSPGPSIFSSLCRKEKFQSCGFGHQPLKKFSPRDVVLMVSRHPCQRPLKAPSVEKLGAGLFQVCVCWRPWRCCRFSFSTDLRFPCLRPSLSSTSWQGPALERPTSGRTWVASWLSYCLEPDGDLILHHVCASGRGPWCLQFRGLPGLSCLLSCSELLPMGTYLLLILLFLLLFHCGNTSRGGGWRVR